MLFASEKWTGNLMRRGSNKGACLISCWTRNLERRASFLGEACTAAVYGILLFERRLQAPRLPNQHSLPGHTNCSFLKTSVMKVSLQCWRKREGSSFYSVLALLANSETIGWASLPERTENTSKYFKGKPRKKRQEGRRADFFLTVQGRWWQ